MRALLVRVGADQSESGGRFNGPVDARTNEFAYIPISEDIAQDPALETPYLLVSPVLMRFGIALPPRLEQTSMHLDPDFSHRTYGDRGRRGYRINTLDPGDALVFYAGLRNMNPQQTRLIYAIIGLYVIEEILLATSIPPRPLP